jgi:cytochrome P450
MISDNEADYDIEELVDDFVTFFLAGAHTTATTLAYVFRELCRNENVLQKYFQTV